MKKVHLSINVSDINASVDFYRRLFGTEPVKVRADYAKFDVAQPPLNFTMNLAEAGTGGPLSHLGIQVDSTADVLAAGKRWTENGIATLDEMKTDCCYALQDKIWAADPDGNRWEVFTVLENTEGRAASPCCAT
jgi:catechol 2,3-dioxygenase-like lactoylglutathione lyase family enzyme